MVALYQTYSSAGHQLVLERCVHSGGLSIGYTMAIPLPRINDVQERHLMSAHDRIFTMKHTKADFSLELKHNTGL